jgi:hypothetical protein
MVVVLVVVLDAVQGSSDVTSLQAVAVLCYQHSHPT